KEERKLKGKEYYQNNKEKISLQRKEYRKNHKKEIKEHYQKNKEKILQKKKEYRKIHKEEIDTYNKKYSKCHKEERKKYDKEYRKKHKIKRNKNRNAKLKTDINFKIAFNLRTRLRSAIKNNQKVGSAVRDLGCTIPELKLYLESKFQDGMSWKNYGYWGWHIDHIIPLYSFNLQNREEFLKACHYTNLQPMWAEENFKKGKYI
ncbi:MAG: hypothetical protein WC495_07110, partial [Patescibacteria group bacterium]